MTIRFKTYADMKKFCGKMFTGDTKDNTLPVFSRCDLNFLFEEAQVEGDMSAEEVQEWLNNNRIKVNYVSQF